MRTLLFTKRGHFTFFGTSVWLAAFSLIAYASLTQYADAGFLGDVWGGLKKVGGAIVSAPGKAIRWGVGQTIGQAVGGAVDPALDSAAQHFRDAGNSLIDHAADKAQETLKEGLKDFDKIAENRLTQLDDIAQRRLDQVNQIMTDRIAQFEDVSMRLIQKQAQVIDASLDKQEQILDRSLNRVDEILSKNVDRLDEISTNAFDRVEAAVQDQVPFAAGKVAQELVMAVIVITLVVVLIGYGGVMSLRAFHASSSGSFLNRFLDAIKILPREFATVGIPLLIGALCIYGIYSVYLGTVQRARVARLQDAAEILETAGDFNGALKFRRRVVSLRVDQEQDQYRFLRDELLADFSRPSASSSRGSLEPRFAALQQRFSKYVAGDLELEAADLYLQEKLTRYVVIENEEDRKTVLEHEQDVAARLDVFLKKLQDTKKTTTLGKYAFLSRLRLLLDNPVISLQQRLNDASKLVDELLSRYQNYATALVLRAQLTAMRGDMELNRRVPGPTDQLLQRTREDLGKAALYDLDRVNLVQISSFTFSSETANRLAALAAVPMTARATPEFQKQQAEAKLAVDTAALGLQKQIQGVLTSDFMSRYLTEMQIRAAMSDAVGSSKLKKLIEDARAMFNAGESTNAFFKKCVEISVLAERNGQPFIAEMWRVEAGEQKKIHPDMAKEDEVAANLKALDDIHKYRLSLGLVMVY